MQASGSAEGDQGKLTWIIATLDGHDAQGTFHVRIYYLQNAGRELLQGHAHALLLQPLGCKPTSSLGVERELSSEESITAEPAQEQIRIGHRRLCAASIADWAGISSGRL